MPGSPWNGVATTAPAEFDEESLVELLHRGADSALELAP